jgi:dienelactone hydrolase
VVTFHAALPAPSEAEAKAIKPRILVCHGEADLFIPADAIKAFRAALDKAGVKYEFVGYKDVYHSFTVPEADKHNIKGMKYDKTADEDSWKRMRALFKDTLGK